MKKILTLILALAMCLSLCACGNRDIASPGTANEETADDANNDAENSNAVSNGDDAVGSDGKVNTNDTANNVNGESNTPDSGNNILIGGAVAPESTEEYKYTSGNASIDISYGDGMSVSETDDGSVSIEYNDCRLYVQNVNSEFNPNSDDPATFLYDYAYNKCVDLVVATYGEIIQFNGEYTIDTTGNEIYAYGAHMTCDPQIQAYAFIKLVTLDDGEGYAVMIGICDEYNAGIFDNIEVQ